MDIIIKIIKRKDLCILEHRTVNGKCNIITDAYVTKGNLHDSVVCTDRLEYQKNILNLDIKKVGLDSGYDTIDIKNIMIEKLVKIVLFKKNVVKIQNIEQ